MVHIIMDYISQNCIQKYMYACDRKYIEDDYLTTMVSPLYSLNNFFFVLSDDICCAHDFMDAHVLRPSLSLSLIISSTSQF